MFLLKLKKKSCTWRVYEFQKVNQPKEKKNVIKKKKSCYLNHSLLWEVFIQENNLVEKYNHKSTFI